MENDTSDEEASDDGNMNSMESNDPNVLENKDNMKYNTLNFSLANARSLSTIVVSLVDKFRELELDFSIITETWFKNDREHRQELEDIKNAEKIEFICKNRPTRGGGVAIAFDTTNMKLKALPVPGQNEVVAAVGCSTSISRPIVIIAVYLPPKQKADTTRGICSTIADVIEKAKLKHSDPYIVVGGDINKKNFLPAYEDFLGCW